MAVPLKVHEPLFFNTGSKMYDTRFLPPSIPSKWQGLRGFVWTASMAVSTVRSAVKGIDIGAPFARLMVSSADCCNCAREVCRRAFDTPYRVWEGV